jgi:beta-galactosidase
VHFLRSIFSTGQRDRLAIGITVLGLCCVSWAGAFERTSFNADWRFDRFGPVPDGHEGEVTPVHLYTSGDEAELFLNGRSLGRKRKGEREYRLRWDDVRYEPGELKAVAYRNRTEWAVATRRTTGGITRVQLSADRAELRADGDDLAFITVSFRDSRGDVVPDAAHAVQFSLDGPAVIAGVDNGDATSHAPMQADQTKAFHGLCLVILRTQSGRSGEIRLTARSDGLPEAICVLRSSPATPTPAL